MIDSMTNSLARTLMLIMTIISGLALLTTGCAQDNGPTRYDISGSVTLDEKPLQHGSIIFTPDTDKGNSGPQGVAKIENGQYNTANQGRGTVGGPHTVDIMVEDPNFKPEDAELSGEPHTKHRTEVDLPKENTIHNFNIDSSETNE